MSISLDSEIKKALVAHNRFPVSKAEFDTHDKTMLESKKEVRISSRFIIDQNAKTPIGEYVYSNKVIKPSASAKDFEYLWTHRANLYLAMLARRSDMFGLLYRYKRTAYVTTDITGTKVVSDVFGAATAENMTNFLIGDLDQIMFVAHIYGEQGRIFKNPVEAVICCVLQLEEVEYKSGSENLIKGDVAYISVLDNEDSAFSEQYKPALDAYIQNIPSFVFGPNWIFDAKSVVHREFTSKTGHYDRGALVHLFAFAEKISRDRNFSAVFLKTPSVDLSSYNDDIFSSFYPGMQIIPYIVPTDANQLQERPPVGRVTVERLVAILQPDKLSPKTIMDVKSPHRPFQRFIRISLRDYNGIPSN